MLTCDLSDIASILFVNVNFTHVGMEKWLDANPHHDSQCAYSYYKEIFCVNIIRCPMCFGRWNHKMTHFQEERDIAFTSNFCDNHSHSASLYLMSPRVRPTHPHVPYLKSLVWHPQVPSPHTRVLLSSSPCPRPTFIHSPWNVYLAWFEYKH